MLIGRWSADTAPPGINLVKSRDPSIFDGSYAVVQDGDDLGRVTWWGDDGTDLNTPAARILVEVDGTPGANDLPGRMSFHTTPNGSASLAERMRIDNAGGVFIGDTANANMTRGLTINQAGNDDQALALKSSDVSQPVTNVAEADTYFDVLKSQATSGGALLRGFKDSGGIAGAAIQLRGYLGEAADTTKSTGAFGVHMIDALVTDGGAGSAEVGTDGNLAVIRNGGTTRFIFDAEGSGHADVEWTTYDTYDDLDLINEIEYELLGVEDAGQTERRRFLEQSGIIGQGSWHFEDGRQRAMVNFSKLSMLHHGALIQVGERFTALEAELEDAKQQLKALEA